MTRLGGYAVITWTETGGAGTERVFRLSAPLREQVPSHVGAVEAVDSLDLTQREVFTFGAGAYELTGQVRFSENPQGLLDLIRAGAENTTLTYYPDVTDSGVSHAVKLVDPVNAKTVQRDAQTSVHGDVAVTLTFRRTDQGVFGAAFSKDELFSYRAGDRLDEASVTRASTASYVDKGWGTVKYASTNTARITWVRTSTSDQTRPEPALLLEKASTNLVKESSDFGQWTMGGGLSRTSGRTAPSTANAAWLLKGSATTATNAFTMNTTAGSTATMVLSFWAKEATTTTPTGLVLFTVDETTNSANDIIDGRITWSSGIPGMSYNVGTTATTPEKYRDEWWRITVRTTAGVVSGRGYSVKFVPAFGTTSTGDVYLYGVQLEQ